MFSLEICPEKVETTLNSQLVPARASSCQLEKTLLAGVRFKALAGDSWQAAGGCRRFLALKTATGNVNVRHVQTPCNQTYLFPCPSSSVPALPWLPERGPQFSTRLLGLWLVGVGRVKRWHVYEPFLQPDVLDKRHVCVGILVD
jgi:hypothetical protein